MATITLGTATVTTDEIVTIALDGETVTLTGEEAAYVIDLAGRVDGADVDGDTVGLDAVISLPGDMVVTVGGVALERDDIAERVSVGFARVIHDVVAGK